MLQSRTHQNNDILLSVFASRHSRSENDIGLIVPKTVDDVARDFVASLHGYCLGLDTFPKRGTLRNDLRPDLRLLGYRRKATIAFTVQDDAVRVLPVFGRGQNVEVELER